MTTDMIQLDIHVLRPQQRRHAIFVSAGDRETFASYALSHLSDAFDILIFQYGISPEKRAHFLKNSIFFATGSGTKFNALKEIFSRHREMLLRYETIWVCDDDLIPETGDLRLLPAACIILGIPVLSPAHSIRGKISYQIMLPMLGRHFLRFTSFVEMTCPLFSASALARFLEAYDGSLSGFYEDWWFLNVLNADVSAVAAIVDNVTVINPQDRHKPGGYGEIELLGTRDALTLIWLEAKKKHGLRQWPVRTRFRICIDVAGISALGYEPALFQRTFGAALRIFLAKWNYRMRFYNLRKRFKLW